MNAIDIFSSIVNTNNNDEKGRKVLDALYGFMKNAVKSTNNMNTWFVLKRGYISKEDIENDRFFDVKVGKEYENSMDCVVDLIHKGFFPDRTVFAVCTRMLSREDNKSFDENERLKKMFQFYIVNGTIFRPLAFDDLVSILEGCENDIVKIGIKLDKRADYENSVSIKTRDKSFDNDEKEEVFDLFGNEEWNVSPLSM